MYWNRRVFVMKYHQFVVCLLPTFMVSDNVNPDETACHMPSKLNLHGLKGYPCQSAGMKLFQGDLTHSIDLLPDFQGRYFL